RKLSHRSGVLVKAPAKRRQDCGRGGLHCACRNMQPTNTLILKACVQRQNERRLADAGGAVNVDGDGPSGCRPLAREAQFLIASRQCRAAPLSYQVGNGRCGHEATFSSRTHRLIMTPSVRSVYMWSPRSRHPGARSLRCTNMLTALL